MSNAAEAKASREEEIAFLAMEQVLGVRLRDEGIPLLHGHVHGARVRQVSSDA